MKRAANRREFEQVLSAHESCQGKRCYLNHSDAAKLAKRERRNQDHTVEAYHCNNCHAWHIGGVRPKRKVLNAKIEKLREGQAA